MVVQPDGPCSFHSRTIGRPAHAPLNADDAWPGRQTDCRADRCRRTMPQAYLKARQREAPHAAPSGKTPITGDRRMCSNRRMTPIPDGADRRPPAGSEQSASAPVPFCQRSPHSWTEPCRARVRSTSRKVAPLCRPAGGTWPSLIPKIDLPSASPSPPSRWASCWPAPAGPLARLPGSAAVRRGCSPGPAGAFRWPVAWPRSWRRQPATCTVMHRQPSSSAG